MEMNGKIDFSSNLGAVLIHADGTREDMGIISGEAAPIGLCKADLSTWWKRLLYRLRVNDRGIVTTAGVNYMASDFASGGVTPTISGFKFHASGVGTTAAAVGDTTIQTDPTPAPARVSGTASNPAANQYRSVATIAYTGTNAITEWGLFSALTAGTLWDRRVFAAINVVSGDSIQITYTLTVNNGGT